MKIYLSELLAIGVIFGFLWAVVPWIPLSPLEGIFAGFYLFIISAGILAAVEQGFIAIIEFFRGYR